MTRKEFIDNVKFRLSLREWAATQPGYKSPVTEKDVETVMAKIRPQFKKVKRATRPTPADLAKLKYSLLVEVTKKETAKKKLPFSIEITVINRKKVESELLKEKLLQMKGGAFSVSAKGKRFIEEFERTHKVSS
jgi:predicted transcriptional regulator